MKFDMDGRRRIIESPPETVPPPEETDRYEHGIEPEREGSWTWVVTAVVMALLTFGAGGWSLYRSRPEILEDETITVHAESDLMCGDGQVLSFSVESQIFSCSSDSSIDQDTGIGLPADCFHTYDGGIICEGTIVDDVRTDFYGRSRISEERPRMLRLLASELPIRCAKGRLFKVVDGRDKTDCFVGLGDHEVFCLCEGDAEYSPLVRVED